MKEWSNRSMQKIQTIMLGTDYAWHSHVAGSVHRGGGDLNQH